MRFEIHTVTYQREISSNKFLPLLGPFLGEILPLKYSLGQHYPFLVLTPFSCLYLNFPAVILKQGNWQITWNHFSIFVLKMQFWNIVDYYYPSKLFIIISKNKTKIKINCTKKYVKIINAILTTLPTSCYFTKVWKTFRYYFQ